LAFLAKGFSDEVPMSPGEHLKLTSPEKLSDLQQHTWNSYREKVEFVEPLEHTKVNGSVSLCLRRCNPENLGEKGLKWKERKGEIGFPAVKVDDNDPLPVKQPQTKLSVPFMKDLTGLEEVHTLSSKQRG
jgi:hypothetical protein